MERRTHWRIDANFGWIHLRLRTALGFPAGSGGSPLEHQGLARFLLFSELERSRPAQQALAEVASTLRGDAGSEFAFPRFTLSSARVEELARLLARELDARTIELGFEPFPQPFTERQPLDFELPPLGPAAAAAPETSFIAVRLLDERGAPVVGSIFQIELPDGSIHRGTTDEDGFGRVSGFTQDGKAKVSFPEFDEVDFKTKGADERIIIPVTDAPSQPGPEVEDDEEFLQEEEAGPESVPADPASDLTIPEAAFVFTLIDQDGDPVAGRRFVAHLPNGETVSGSTNGLGMAGIEAEGLVGEIEITFVDLDQTDFDFKPALPGTRSRETGPVGGVDAA